jgi:membrane-bound metal-dependent hydrolase YbcI (DUF457 family)
VFLGHFALGLGAKRLAPRASLGILFLSAQFADLLWPVLVLLGVEVVRVELGVTTVTPLDFVSYPYSHSLLALIGWGLLLGWLYAWRKRYGLRELLVVAALVVSHWLLDFLTHRADLPWTLHGVERAGLGLWHSRPGTLVVELSLFAVGIAVYLATTRARDATGRYALAGLLVFLTLVYLASVFGPPPPNAEAVAWTALSMWLLVAWGGWIDRHREPLAPAPGPVAVVERP